MNYKIKLLSSILCSSLLINSILSTLTLASGPQQDSLIIGNSTDVPISYESISTNPPSVNVSLSEIKPITNQIKTKILITNEYMSNPSNTFSLHISFDKDSCLSLPDLLPNLHNLTINGATKIKFNIDVGSPPKDRYENIKFILINDSNSSIVTTFTSIIHIPHINKKAIIIVPGTCGSEIVSSKSQTVNGTQYSKGYRIWPPEAAAKLVSSQSYKSQIIGSSANTLIQETNSENGFDESVIDTSVDRSSEEINSENGFDESVIGTSVDRSSEEINSENGFDESVIGTSVYRSNEKINSEIASQQLSITTPVLQSSSNAQSNTINISNITNIDSERLLIDLSNLICFPDGSSKINTMASYPFDCRNNHTRCYGSIDTYAKLCKSLTKDEMLNNYDIIFFSYDWRESNKKSAYELETFINENKYDKVALIGHSMGGLVCASYISNIQNAKKVESFISLGTPFLGAVKAISAVNTGYFFDGIINMIPIVTDKIKSVVKNIVINCQSVYELFPPQQTFEYSSEPFIKLTNLPNQSGCFSCFFKPKSTLINSFEESKKLLLSTELSSNAEYFFNNAQKFHNSLYDSTSGKSNLSLLIPNKLYNIVGYNTPTIGQVEISVKNKKISKIEYSNSANGDGTVTLSSSTLGFTIPDETSYYISNIEHLELIKNDDCIDLIKNIIAGNSQTFNASFIHQFKPSNIIEEKDCCLPICSCLKTCSKKDKAYIFEELGLK